MNVKGNIRTGALAALLIASAAAWPVCAYERFELGVGCVGTHWTYGKGGTPLDVARHDWTLLLFPNEPETMETVDCLNRVFEINPKFKVLVRLWDSSTYKRAAEGPKAPKRSIGFLDYLYYPESREILIGHFKAQLDLLLDNVTHPDNIYGYTFWEELPSRFAPHPELRLTAPDAKPGEYLQDFAAQYEAETGRKMGFWDREMRIWWGRKLAEALRDLHVRMKKDYPKLKGLVYFQAPYRLLDFMDEGEEIHAPRVIPLRYSDIIGPDAAYGLFIYSNSKEQAARQQAFARKNGYPYFSQLSHTGTMRIGSWKDCYEIANADIPENLGYFHYEADFVYGRWNDDPEVRPDETDSKGGFYLRRRRWMAKTDVNMDIVRAHLKPTPRPTHALGDVQVGDVGLVEVPIENPRDESWFVNPDEAVLKNVKVRINLPPEFSVPLDMSAPPELVIPVIAAGGRRSARWWVRRDAPTADPSKFEISFDIEADGVPSSRTVFKGAVCRPEPQTRFLVTESGETMRYSNWGLGKGNRPVVFTIAPLKSNRHACVVDPAIENMGTGHRLMWRGEIPYGSKLVLGPDRAAKLISEKGEETDVSAQVQGLPVRIKGGGDVCFRYFDCSGTTGGPKAEVILDVQAPLPDTKRFHVPKGARKANK